MNTNNSSSIEKSIKEAIESHLMVDKIPFDGANSKYSGKVREMFYFDDTAAIACTDRVSVFDYKIGTVPFKGRVLNMIAAWWFAKLDEIGVKHHLIEMLHPNVSLVKKAKPLDIEIVMRGYLTGSTITSSWHAYQNHNRIIGGIEMPEGMKKNQPFPEALFTPTTKARDGRDENISKEDIVKKGILSSELLEQAESIARKVFAFGQKVAAEKGLILVDTKYEMGITDDGELILIDEVHTPDSSRYWFADSYEQQMNDGKEPENIDKEFIRRMIVGAGYDVTSDQNPADFFSEDMQIEASKRYIEIYRQVTGEDLPIGHTKVEEIVEKLKAIAS